MTSSTLRPATCFGKQIRWQPRKGGLAASLELLGDLREGLGRLADGTGVDVVEHAVANAGQVGGPGLLELGEAGWRELGDVASSIQGAGPLRDQTTTLEVVDEPGHATGGQCGGVGEVGHPQL